MVEDRARRRPHILVVHDEPRVCVLVVEALTEAGYRIDCAYDGEEALARLRSRLRVDVALVPPLLGGGVDGAEVRREARRRGVRVLRLEPGGAAPAIEPLIAAIEDQLRAAAAPSS